MKFKKLSLKTWIRNLRIGRLLILTFVAVTMVSSLGGFVGYIMLNGLTGSYSYALTDYGFSQGDVGKFHAEFEASCTVLRDVINASNSTSRLARLNELDSTNARVDQYFANMQKVMVSSTEINNYKKMKVSLEQYRQSVKRIVELAKQDNVAEANAVLIQQTPLTNQITSSTQALVDEKTQTGNLVSDSLSQKATESKIIIISVMVLSIAASVLLACIISRSISSPLSQMQKAAESISEGSLDVQLHVNSANEIGQLAGAFKRSADSINAYILDVTNNLDEIGKGNLTVTSNLDYLGDYSRLKESITDILNSLNELLGQIDRASRQVLIHSKQVANEAQLLAQGSSEQANSVEKLFETISEISTHIKSNSDQAEQAKNNVNHLCSEIEECHKHMNDMVSTMLLVSESSNQIKKINKTIQSIALQTNILALNASVEAANAGAAGKGFAVVANEVRELAGKSAKASKDTISLIENEIAQVTMGTQVVNTTAESLISVIESAKTVSNKIEDISQASIRQSTSITQFAAGVRQISAVIQSNTSTAEESAAESEELANQAKNLKVYIEKFHLRESK